MQWPQGLSLLGLVMKACPQLPQPACGAGRCQSMPSPKPTRQANLERPLTGQGGATLHARAASQVAGGCADHGDVTDSDAGEPQLRREVNEPCETCNDAMRPGEQPAHLLLAAGRVVGLGIRARARLPVRTLAGLLPAAVVVVAAAVVVVVVVVCPTIAAPAGDLAVALRVVAPGVGHVRLRARPKLRLRPHTQRRFRPRSQSTLLSVVRRHSFLFYFRRASTGEHAIRCTKQGALLHSGYATRFSRPPQPGRLPSLTLHSAETRQAGARLLLAGVILAGRPVRAAAAPAAPAAGRRGAGRGTRRATGRVAGRPASR